MDSLSFYFLAEVRRVPHTPALLANLLPPCYVIRYQLCSNTFYARLVSSPCCPRPTTNFSGLNLRPVFANCAGTATRDLLSSAGPIAQEIVKVENRIPPPGFQSATSQQVRLNAWLWLLANAIIPHLRF